MSKVITGIYKITSPNGGIYIGQSLDISYRFSKYRLLTGGLKKQTRLYNSLKKYGWQAHNFEIIQECKQCELNSLEVKHIAFNNSFNTRHGLNLTSGGGHFLMSNESKAKISEANRNRTLDVIEKIRKSKLGNKNMLGKHHTPETKNIIAIKKTGIKASENTKGKMSQKRKGFIFSKASCLKMSVNNSKRRSVINDKTGIVYLGVKEAAADNNIKRSTLNAMLTGQNKNHTNLRYASNNI